MGEIAGAIRFDNFCILLRRDGQSQLVYKHAVSTIMPTEIFLFMMVKRRVDRNQKRHHVCLGSSTKT